MVQVSFEFNSLLMRIETWVNRQELDLYDFELEGIPLVEKLKGVIN